MALNSLVLFFALFLALVAGEKTCDAKKGSCEAPFTTYGLPSSRGGLPLIAAGMRRKFFLDVYAVGLYQSEKTAMSKGIKKVADLEKLSEVSGGLFGPSSLFVLVFSREVGTDQMVGGMVDALSGGNAAYKKSLDSFKSILTKAVGPKGIKIKDEIEFSYGGDSIDISFNGKKAGTVSDAKELKKKLMLVYAGTSSVAPEIHEILKKKLIK